MPKAKNEKAERARELYQTGWKLADIAEKMGLPAGTVRRWKSVYGWGEKNKANARKETNVANVPSAAEITSVIDNPDLTEKQRLFILYYAKNFNAARAYQKAYECTRATALTEGPALLKNPRVREEIMRVKRERCEKAFLTEEDVFQRYMDIAFADITDFVEFGQEEVPVMAMYGPVTIKDPDTGEKMPLTKMVNVVRSRSSAEVDGAVIAEVSQGKDGFKIKLSDKMKALQWLSDHMNLATDEQRARIDKLRAETKEMSGRGKGEPGGGGRPFELPARLLAPSFLPVHLDILEHGHMEYVEKGGRGSAKSSFISLEIIALLKNNPFMHALCCRKVGNTLRDSVFAQVQWAIDALGLGDEFESTKSPLEITYTPTGQKIYFRGADDPIKLKSIKPTFGYIGVLWLEELDQFSGDEECRSIQQSAIRGGDEAYIFKSFNPPITRDNWANRYCEQEKENRLVTHSDYKSVPEKWLGKPFLEEAEHLRITDKRAYDHEYMGEATGTGGNVFEKLELREITDQEIASFDRIFQGIDFGWFPDPFAFIRMHYDRKNETIYLLDEIYKNKLHNETAAAEIREKGYTDAYITCDSAEPKSVADLRACGIPAKEAVKGPGSVDYGMKWLQKRTIVIDRRRTPKAYEEFVHYEYERDRNGAFISGYPGENDHIISAVRYGMERVFRRMGVTA